MTAKGRVIAAVGGNLRTARPSVYLDQWVWIRLAKVAVGRPDNPNDRAVFDAVVGAADAGVAFPLSATHYYETLAIADPRQRNDLAAVMAPISRFLNLRRTLDLVRHQMLNALHEQYGRPAFRPSPPQALGLGIGWAMVGVRVPLKIMTGSGSPRREVSEADDADIHVKLRSLGQLGETRLIAGPSDADIPLLRERGYRPEVAEASTRSRIAYEQFLADQLLTDRVSRRELRVWVMARELTHEYYDLFVDILREYRLDPFGTLRQNQIEPGSKRSEIMRLSDAIPTMRVAADMKLEIFRNPQRRWSVNMMRDIDALSQAVPYCHIVVPDRDAADLLARSNGHTRHGTTVVTRFSDLPGALAELELPANLENLSGWDHIGPPAPFCANEADISWHI